MTSAGACRLAGRAGAAFTFALAIAGCATRPIPLERPVGNVPPNIGPPAEAPPRLAPSSFASLPGWDEEDHAAAFAAFVRTCDAGAPSRGGHGFGSYGPAASAAPSAPSALGGVCAEARAMGPLGETQARQFFETRFTPERIEGEGLLTAYFSPIYEARHAPDAVFSDPVRPRPPDLPRNPPPGAWPDRAAIEAQPASDALAWMRPEDLFFLQIQGSGVLTFESGARARAVFDGSNGLPFVAIASPMRQQGLLPPARSGGGDVKGWLAAHRGPDAAAVMDQDPRYVFFRLAPDDGGEPAGAAGRPLVPGRSLAIDPSAHAMGELLWIDGEAPTLAGAPIRYRRLAVALDTGGAIKGVVRADLYTGRGDAAGAEAGRVRHTLRLWRLVPRS